MQEMCPLSFEQVNERAVQINATLAFCSILIFFFSPYKWVIFILAIDFLIRGFLKAKYSFYSAISKTILRIFKIKPIMVNAGPKIFAAKLGFIFCCIVAASYFLNFHVVSYVAGSIFLFFAALEALFRFCVACKVYPYIVKIKSTIAS